jgi:Tfp pilus assembly protein PilZ
MEAARVRDLSEGGFRLFTCFPYRQGDPLRISMSIPGFGRRLGLTAEVRWFKAGEDDTPSTVGCRFVHSPLTVALVQDLMAELIAGNLPEIQRRSGDTTLLRSSKG